VLERGETEDKGREMRIEENENEKEKSIKLSSCLLRSYSPTAAAGSNKLLIVVEVKVSQVGEWRIRREN
jgi:hypothetical protein